MATIESNQLQCRKLSIQSWPPDVKKFQKFYGLLLETIMY